MHGAQPVATPSTQGVANQRELEDFQRAHNHSKRVQVLKFALPVVASLIVVLFVSSIFFSGVQFGNLSIESAGIEGGKLVMDKPKMAGFDSKNRPYDVTAVKAIQDPKTPSLVVLESINALLPVNQTSKARITAKGGIYNSEKETMVLKEDIRLTNAQGMEIKLHSANIDMKKGTMKSDQPVTVKSRDTLIHADTVEVLENGANIIFKKRVRMTIQPSALNRDETK